MNFPAHAPLVVGSILTREGLGLLAAAKLPADVAEVRVDALLQAGVSEEEIEAALKARRHPVLLTLRIPAEGGHRTWKLTHRRKLYLHLLPHAEAVDLELVSAGALHVVVDVARAIRKTLVLSAHSIERPATAAQMENWVSSFPATPHSILKIAARIESWRDLQRLAAVLINHPDWDVAVMGLGPHAAQSRLVLAALGSRLVYGYLDVPAAAGQPSAAEVRKMIEPVRELRPATVPARGKR